MPPRYGREGVCGSSPTTSLKLANGKETFLLALFSKRLLNVSLLASSQIRLIWSQLSCSPLMTWVTASDNFTPSSRYRTDALLDSRESFSASAEGRLDPSR